MTSTHSEERHGTHPGLYFGKMPIDFAQEVSVLREKKWVGVKAARDGLADLVLFSGQGARSAGPEGIETDGKLAAFTADRNGRLLTAALDGGTLLKVRGKTIRLRKAEGTVCLGGGLQKESRR